MFPLFERIKRLVKAFIGSLFHPDKSRMSLEEMELTLREMRVTLMKIKEAAAVASAHEKRAKIRCDAELQRQADCLERARRAVEQSLTATPTERIQLENHAKQALKLRNDSLRNSELLHTAWQNAKLAADSARHRFEKAATEVEQRAQILREAQILKELNDARKELHELTGVLGSDEKARAFDEGMEHIRWETDKLNALDKLATHATQQADYGEDTLAEQAEVEQQYKSLVNELTPLPSLNDDQLPLRPPRQNSQLE